MRFYTELLGAEIETATMGDFQYQMLKKGDRTPRRLRRQADGAARGPRLTGTRTSTSTTWTRRVEKAKELGRDG